MNLKLLSLCAFILVMNFSIDSISKTKKQPAGPTQDDGSKNLINLNGAGSDEENPNKPVNKNCIEFDKLYSALYSQLHRLPDEMAVEMQKLKDSSEQADFERKYQKKGKDLQLKIVQLQTNPKYKKCEGSLSGFGM